MISPKSIAITRETSCMNSRSLCSMIRMVSPASACRRRISAASGWISPEPSPAKGSSRAMSFGFVASARDLEAAEVAVRQHLDRLLGLRPEADEVEDLAGAPLAVAVRVDARGEAADER